MENKIETPETEEKVEKTAAPEEKKKDKAGKLKAELAAEKERADKAEAALLELNDKYMRLAAEYDNFRKRSAKEKEALYGDSVAGVAAAFLPIVDCAEMAAVYATDGGELAKGVLMMKKQSAEIMAKLKIEVIDPTGEQFDPTYHNAILHEEDEESPENTVKETLQKGYRIGDRVIRYALVKVVN